METITIDGKTRTVNLYAHKGINGYDRVIMPSEETLSFDITPVECATGNWIAAVWPVNPHFTGKSGILALLNASLK